MNASEHRNVSPELVHALRSRAAKARRNANIALLSIFVLLFAAISIFYLAGDIAIREVQPVKEFLR